MILILREKSFKSMEADYSNRLASPLVASSGETSPSPRICCDKIKSPYQRYQFLGTQKQATPRMSRMDPMRAWEWQDEVAGTSLVTRKFSSSIFCWKKLRKI